MWKPQNKAPFATSTQAKWWTVRNTTLLTRKSTPQWWFCWWPCVSLTSDTSAKVIKVYSVVSSFLYTYNQHAKQVTADDDNKKCFRTHAIVTNFIKSHLAITLNYSNFFTGDNSKDISTSYCNCLKCKTQRTATAAWHWLPFSIELTVLSMDIHGSDCYYTRLYQSHDFYAWQVYMSCNYVAALCMFLSVVCIFELEVLAQGD